MSSCTRGDDDLHFSPDKQGPCFTGGGDSLYKLWGRGNQFQVCIFITRLGEEAAFFFFFVFPHEIVLCLLAVIF